jgi:glycosyltransferase involved in cell wall biosynthesis
MAVGTRQQDSESSARKPRLAVVSPFLDKSHGSERIVTEWLSRLSGEFDIHIYSQRVEDLERSTFTWHRIPKLPGPHIFNFIWWFAANQVWRRCDRQFRGMRYDLVFSPGANCLDADVVSVHILFSEYVRENRERLRLTQSPSWVWPRVLHRKLYYSLAVFLERRVYRNPQTMLIAVSRAASVSLENFCGRGDFPVLYAGIDPETFSVEKRMSLRQKAREKLELAPDHFALLLIGNDWRNKGVPVLLDALEQLRDLPIRLFVVSRENSSACWELVEEKGFQDRVRFLAPRNDIEFYYAAADAYVGPSLQDAYAMPPAEAMACGLPVIVSSAAGVSEIITDGVDGLILSDSKDALTLATMIRRLYADEAFRKRLAERAALTARKYTWERNAQELAAIFEEVLRRKAAQSLEGKSAKTPGVVRRS